MQKNVRQSSNAVDVGSRVSLSNVSFGVDSREILNQITLEFSSTRVGIVGRNGSGKSTFARVVAGLVSPNAGSVLVNDTDLAKNRRAALSEVGILFQNPDHQIIFPTVLEEIAFGLSQLGRENAEDLAQETLDQFGKAHWRDANVSTLSQGQKHLVCLMSIVAMAPKLLILDEPFAGLDIPTKAQLNRYMEHYQGSLLHITHDPKDLLGYQQIVWLDQGQVRMSGNAMEVLSAYEDEMNRVGAKDDISDLSS